ncbi:MAG TPA: methyl-accepting chemotaxis protein [Gammaproteobacteria bacterium]|nr:methyl-accepting chemotaxis protein [Gammaproteobacteria bacterium]
MSASNELRGKLGANKRLMPLVVLLLVALAATFGIFYYVGKQSNYNKQYISYASEQQVLSQRIAKSTLEAAGGSKSAFAQVKLYRQHFNGIMDKLENGDPKTGLPGAPEASADALAGVRKQWKTFSGSVDEVLGGKKLVLSVSETAGVINKFMPQLLSHYQSVVDLLVKNGASAEQVSVASRQMMLAQRIVNNMSKVLAGENTASATQQFAKDTEEFGKVLEGEIRGSNGVKAITNPQAQAKLRQIAMLFSSVSDYVGELLNNSQKLLAVQSAAKAAARDSDQLFAATGQLRNSFTQAAASRLITTRTAYGSGAIVLLILLWMGVQIYQDQTQRTRIAEENNKRNQEAILRLLDEMGNLADGDLTRYATVTEDFTGAIADSINYTIDALRDLITTINETSEQVSSGAEQTRQTAVNLSEASENQAQEITSASTAINEMAVSIDEVSQHAVESADVAQRSVEIAHKGGDTVRRTIEGMDVIREQIQETSKRIKRLGESSQEIGDIVELINDIAEQPNILALNAAIQAAMAGEAGRGFAVVADEVQRLAERSANATKQIEALVKTIQTDTNEAVISMEQSTAGVVSGAKLAEDAGEALEEIESVSKNLSDLIQNISTSARQQSGAAGNISQTMHVIQEITMQTNTGTNETAASIGNLAELANDLRRSVAGFKLPE